MELIETLAALWFLLFQCVIFDVPSVSEPVARILYIFWQVEREQRRSQQENLCSH